MIACEGCVELHVSDMTAQAISIASTVYYRGEYYESRSRIRRAAN
jgi:hypothetical protein